MDVDSKKKLFELRSYYDKKLIRLIYLSASHALVRFVIVFAKICTEIFFKEVSNWILCKVRGSEKLISTIDSIKEESLSFIQITLYTTKNTSNNHNYKHPFSD